MPDIINDVMLRNYLACVEETGGDEYSTVWDLAHYSNFSEIIKDRHAWPDFLSNGISEAMSGAPYKDGNRIKNTELTDVNAIDRFRSGLNEIRKIAGKSFVDPLLQGKIGNPVHAEIDGEKIVFHDLRLVFNAWSILEISRTKNYKQPLIVEIGAGYGGLTDKIHKTLEGSKIILIDLPEANAIQTYFLKQVLPDVNFFYYSDFQKLGIDGFLQSDADIAILPTIAFNDIPDDSVDIFINIRSMMEMNKET